MFKPGDIVRLRVDPRALGKVKSVSEGGSVLLKSALHGHRCWSHEDLELVQAAPTESSVTPS